jgi:hypothetical protein
LGSNDTIMDLQWWLCLQSISLLKHGINSTSEFSLHIFTFVLTSSV